MLEPFHPSFVTAESSNHYAGGASVLDTSFQSNVDSTRELTDADSVDGLSSTTTSTSAAHQLLAAPAHCPRTSSVSSASSATVGTWLSLANLPADSPAAAAALQAAATRIGYARALQIFLFHSSNLLLNRHNLHKDKIKNVACYVLEIYKMFIRKIKMDHYTWLASII